jgi:hypothetical protein
MNFNGTNEGQQIHWSIYITSKIHDIPKLIAIRMKLKIFLHSMVVFRTSECFMKEISTFMLITDIITNAATVMKGKLKFLEKKSNLLY